MAVLQQTGRIALAKAIAAQTIYIAWGRGDPAWDTAPVPEPDNASALVSEIGRRLVTDVQYATPDPTGSIELPSGERYRTSATPTRYVYLRATFGFADAQGETLREMGVFLGGQLAASVPAGQRWVLAADVQDGGQLYTMERRAAAYRSGAVRQVEEIILPF